MRDKCYPRDFLRLASHRQNALSLRRQLLEIAVLMPWRGVGLGYYQMAGFWRKDLPWRVKTGQLSAKEYRATLARLNPIAYRKLSQHKVAEKALLHAFDVPSSKYLGLFSPQNGWSAAGKPLRNSAELEDFLADLAGNSRVCFKPLEGWAGRGFEVVEVERKQSRLVLHRISSGATMDVEAFCRDVLMRSHGGSSVIEGFLVQHSEMASFNPSSVNTLRLWVLRRGDAPPDVILGYLRIGRQGSLVDNQSNGGIVVPFDLHSGRLSKAIDGLPLREEYSVHPDHGAPIEGRQVPFFAEALAVAGRALLAFAPLRFAGVDVAVTEEGPCVIELNVSPDREGAAFTDTPTKELLAGNV